MWDVYERDGILHVSGMTTENTHVLEDANWKLLVKYPHAYAVFERE